MNKIDLLTILIFLITFTSVSCVASRDSRFSATIIIVNMKILERVNYHIGMEVFVVSLACGSYIRDS